MCEQRCDPTMAGIKIKLHNEDIWNQFHEHTTEMIITKSGRRMFPYLRLEITGLDPEARYFVLLEFNISSNKRFKFNGTCWTPIGNAEPQLPPSSRLYVHPDSPAVGQHWMSQSVLFNKVKLTNHTLDRTGNVVLTSMHKYLPCVHIVMASDVLAVHWSPTATFTFKETEFVGVTAYQNEKITKLKIYNNPFAKGFRETGQSRLKRKLYNIKEEIQEEKEDCKRVPPPIHQLPALQADDSGISSVGSVTPPISDSEDIIKKTNGNSNIYDGSHYLTSPLHKPWMDLPLPPYPIIPPYCPTLWPYVPYFLPPPPPYLYPNCLQFPCLPSPSTRVSSTSVESCLIDLSMRKET